MSSDPGPGTIIIRRKLAAPLMYDVVTPTSGIGKYLAKIKVWHVPVITFLLGLIF